MFVACDSNQADLDATIPPGPLPFDANLDVPDADVGRPDVPAGCDLGVACTPERGCRRSAFCQGEIMFSLDEDEAIRDLPPGAETMGTLFANGYCTADDLSMNALLFCDPDDELDEVCGECGSCIRVGPDTMCARDCTASANDNSDCRDDGYACDLNLEVCFPGCNSDTECRVRRTETNGIAGLQTPDDCGADPARCNDDATNFDELVYSDIGSPVCNTDTFRCEFTGGADAEAGDTCELDSDCETNGECLDFEDSDGGPAWPGNYCTRFRCDLDGITCAGEGKCQSRGVGVALCLAGCSVGRGEGVDPDDSSTWRVSPDGCRDGYACSWDGAGAADGNGGCVPGEFNDVETPNIGEACTEDSDCWSPFGIGFCIDGFPDGYCTIRDCGAPGLPTGINGTNGVCISGIDPDDDAFALSLATCESPDDCRDDYGCVDVGVDTRACFPVCEVDADCKATQRCDVPDGSTVGSCVDR